MAFNNNFLKKKNVILFLLLLTGIINLVLYVNFRREQQCYNYNLIFLYAFLFLFITLVIKKYILRINLLVFFLIFFGAELYCIFFNKGILTYEEQMGEKHYTSLYANTNLNRFNKYHNWILEPNSETIQTNTDFSFKKTYNANGLRDVEDSIFISKAKKIIIGLGDSFTEGNGAPQDSTWTALLENKINTTTDTFVKVMNAGVAGSDPVYEYRLYSTLLVKYKPDVLILAVNISDIIELMSRGGFNRFTKNGVEYLKPPKWEYLYANSRIFRLIMSAVFKINPYLLISAEEEKIRYQQAFKTFKDCLNKFKLLTGQNHCRLIVVYNPHLFEFKNIQSEMHIEYPFEEDLKKDTLSEKDDLNIIFLRDSLMKYNLIDTARLNDFYWKHDYHFKPIGYNAWADFLNNYLRINNSLRN